MRIIRRLVGQIVVWWVAWWIPQVGAAALAEVHTLDLPAQPLPAALRALALQAGAQIYYDQPLLERYRAPPLRGRLTLAAALDRLLVGQGLRYEVLDGVIMVMRAPAAIVQTQPRMPVSAPARPPPRRVPVPMLEELLVTASKRPEPMQDVPISTTVLGAADIEGARLDRLADIEGSVPNLSISLGQTGGNSALQAFIRGVGELDYLITTDPAVGLYVDGVYIARTTSANFALADVERIEVLRGPQGTLFGKNAIAGAISIATREPGDRRRAMVEAGIGSYGLLELRGDADWPLLADALSVRVSVLSRESDGWQRRPGGDGGAEDKLAGRLGVRWRPGERFESLLVVDGSRQDQPPYANTIIWFNPAAPAAVAYRNAGLSPPCCALNSFFRSGGDSLLARDDFRALGGTWTNTWMPEARWTIRSITGYRDTDAEFGQDYDHSTAAYYAFGDITVHWQFSQELQAIGELGRARWIAGLYHFKEAGGDESILEVVPAAVAADAPITDLNLSSHTRQTTRSQALFAQLDYALTERWQLALGARYTYEKKSYRKRGMRLITGQPQLPASMQPASKDCSATGATTGSPFRCASDWDAFTPKLELSYRWSDTLLLYGLAANGFRSGGFNGRPTALSLIESYDPEYLESLEFGFKAESADHRMRLNGATFFNRYRNKQQTVNIADPTTGSVFLTVNNAGKARIDGFELEAAALLGDRLEARLGVGYTNARFVRWRDALEGDLSRRKFPNAPRWNGNASLTYHWPEGAFGALSWRADLHFQDDLYLDPENNEYLHTPAYTTLNASVRWLAPREDWEVVLSGKNLTDRQELVSGFDGSAFFGVIHANYIAPRRLQLSVRYHVE